MMSDDDVKHVLVWGLLAMMVLSAIVALAYVGTEVEVWNFFPPSHEIQEEAQ